MRPYRARQYPPSPEQQELRGRRRDRRHDIAALIGAGVLIAVVGGICYKLNERYDFLHIDDKLDRIVKEHFVDRGTPSPSPGSRITPRPTDLPDPTKEN